MRKVVAVSVLLLVGAPAGAREGAAVNRAGMTVNRAGAAVNRESIVVDVESNRPDLDEKVRRRFVEKLSPRFDVVEEGGTYVLRVRGTDIYEDHPLKKGKSWSLGTASLDRVEYTIALDLPGGRTEVFGSSFDIKEDGSGGTLAGVFWTFNHWVNKCIPITGAVLEVDPHHARLNVGRSMDVRVGDWFDVYDGSGRLGGSLEVTDLTDTTALARRLSDREIEPGFPIRQRVRLLSWGMGVDYAHLRIPAGRSSRAGHRIMFNVPWRPRFLAPVMLQFSSGYLDVAAERGFQPLAVAAMLVRPINGRAIDLEYGAGLGGAVLRITDKVDPRTGARIKEIGVFTASVYTGLAFHLGRAQSITAGIGTIGYSRFPRPQAPSLQVGYRCWAY
jgi:hypothetical protein